MNNEGRFELLPDGWCLDTKTGLEWSRTAPERMYWDDASVWCEAQGGRMPTRMELYTLVDDGLSAPCAELPDTQSFCYWSASIYASDPVYAWDVGFDCGGVHASSKATNSLSVRAVRGGQKKSTGAAKPSGLVHSSTFNLVELHAKIATELIRRFQNG